MSKNVSVVSLGVSILALAISMGTVPALVVTTLRTRHKVTSALEAAAQRMMQMQAEISAIPVVKEI